MENGRFKEHGSYQELAEKEGDVARLAAEFGGVNDSDSESDRSSETFQDDSVDQEKQRAKERALDAAGTGKLEGRLIVKERRTTGSVSAKGTGNFFCPVEKPPLTVVLVYWKYLTAGRGLLTMPLLMLSIFFMQGSQIMNTYVLVWWQAK